MSWGGYVKIAEPHRAKEVDYVSKESTSHNRLSLIPVTSENTIFCIFQNDHVSPQAKLCFLGNALIRKGDRKGHQNQRNICFILKIIPWLISQFF